jgi:hypothetical protein
MANIAIFILHIILTLFSYHWLYGININNVSSFPMIRRNTWRSFRLKSENSSSNDHSYHWYNRVTQTYMYICVSSRYEKIVKQWCSTMTPTSTKRTISSNIHLLNTKKYHEIWLFWNPGSGLRQTQKYVLIKDQSLTQRSIINIRIW